MVDLSGAANLIVAIIEMARADATAPKLCSPGQRDQVQWEALDFLAVVVEPAREECALDVLIPHRRRPGGGLRWEFSENEKCRRRRRNQQ